MDIIKIFYNSRNSENAAAMKKYMGNRFEFIGIKKPERALLSKEFLKEKKKDNKADWHMIFELYSLEEREFQYLAIDYLSVVKKILVFEDIINIQELITEKSWWDTSDSIDNIVAHMALSDPGIKRDIISKWVKSDNVWLKRVSILFQLKYKENTDTDFLKYAVSENYGTNEFFVDKAIGWALREYSKTNPGWVRDFITQNREDLSSLSYREAVKYI
ncbi:MAG: DNA alkylation repair protein [Thermotogae bacterium]|nr:DNA alkylation repair protein [Thermotogota bacterium]